MADGAITIGRTTIKPHQVRQVQDLEPLYSGDGFYVILTDYPVEGNNCTYGIHNKKKLKAVYRGQGDKLKIRVKSHLFHTQHFEDKDDPQYKNSMKIDKDTVDIDKPPYNKFEWWVVHYPLRNSYTTIRVQMEAAFDEVFGKPPCSQQ